MSAAKELIAVEIKDFTGIDPRQLIDMGIIPVDHAKKWVVKQKYFQLAKTGRTYTDIKNELSDIYGISVSSIEKMIYRK